MKRATKNDTTRSDRKNESSGLIDSMGKEPRVIDYPVITPAALVPTQIGAGDQEVQSHFLAID